MRCGLPVFALLLLPGPLQIEAGDPIAQAPCSEDQLLAAPNAPALTSSCQRWSWCRSKLDRIESKRDIAKAAVDGELAAPPAEGTGV